MKTNSKEKSQSSSLIPVSCVVSVILFFTINSALARPTQTPPAGNVVLPAGPTGPQGPAGLTGSVGPQGPQGPTGSIGPTGSRGPTGSVGQQGYSFQGPTGAQGLQGTRQCATKSEPATWALRQACAPGATCGPWTVSVTPGKKIVNAVCEGTDAEVFSPGFINGFSSVTCKCRNTSTGTNSTCAATIWEC